MRKFNWMWNVYRAPESEGGGEAGGDNAPPPADDAFRSTLAFDPFAPPAKQDAGAGEGEAPPQNADADRQNSGTGEKPAGEGSASQPPAGTSSQPAPGQAQDGDDPLAALREQVQGFLSKASAPKADAQPQPQQTATQPAPQPGAQGEGTKTPGSEVKYDFAIPDTILDGFESEDRSVRKAALGTIVNSLANKLAQDFGAAMVALNKHIESQLPVIIQSQVTRQSSEAQIKSDLYDNYPELKRLAATMPGMEDAMWQQIAAVGQQMNVKSWTPEFRDGVAAIIHLNLGIPVKKAGGAAPTAQTPTPTTRPKPKPTFSAGSGGGAGGRPNGQDTGSQFLEVLGAGS